MAGTANAISFVWDGTDLLNEYVSGALSGRYLTLDGEVLSEKRGASRFVYGVDPLGSVVHLLDSSLNRRVPTCTGPMGRCRAIPEWIRRCSTSGTSDTTRRPRTGSI
jgi:hypothetical protein